MSYKDKFWGSLQEMADALKNADKDPNSATDTYDINSEAAQILGSFLKQWSAYLSPVYDILTPLYVIPGWFVKILYLFSSAVEKVFDNIFALFGLFSKLEEEGAFIGQVYGWLRAGGIAIFLLFIVVRVIMSWTGSSFKYREFINHLILVTAATAFLPQALISLSTTFSNAGQKLSSHSIGDGVAQSLSITPVKDNVTDIMQLVRYNFNTETLGRSDGDNGYISLPNDKKNETPLNTITDDTIQSLDFTASYGATDKDTLEHFKKLSESDKNYYGLPAVLHSSLEAFDYNGDDPVLVHVKGYESKAFWEVENNLKIKSYLRYKVNWIALYAQQIMLILLLIGLLINVLQTVFRVTLSTMVAPIVGYTSVDDSTKFLDLLQSIFAGIAGIWFEILIVRYGLWFLSIAPTISLVQGKTFFSDLNFFESSIASIALYFAVYLAASKGSRAIENWLGIEIGAKSGIEEAGSLRRNTQRAATSGFQAVAGKPGMNGKREGGLVQKAVAARDFGGKAVKSAGRAAVIGAGRAAGVRKAAKEQGGRATAANIAGNAIRNNSVTRAASSKAAAIKERYSSGKTQGYNYATTNAKNPEKAKKTPPQTTSTSTPAPSANTTNPNPNTSGAAHNIKDKVLTSKVNEGEFKSNYTDMGPSKNPKGPEKPKK